MRTVTITAYLPDNLREYLDERIGQVEVPAQVEIRTYFENAELLEDERKRVVERYLTRKFVNTVIEQKESLAVLDFLGPWVPDATHRIYLEDYYAYQFVDRLPGLVERAQSLAVSVVEKRPSDQIVRILREAFKSYIYGFYVACICVCRCVLEKLLEERLKDKPEPIGNRKRPDGRQKGKIEALIDWALYYEILDFSGSAVAKRVLKRGNDAAHDGKASEREAEQVLADVQRLLGTYFLKKDG